MHYSLHNRESRASRQREAAHQRAMEPTRRYCYITKREVTVCIDYPQYVNFRCKGPEGEVYCEHIVECYRKGVKCRHSGISQLYPDPFTPESAASLPDKELTLDNV
ncbi:MAG: hypothetical protein ACI376_09050 [Candidatus Bruticola sp.]